ELERGGWTGEAAGSVDPRRKPETNGALVDGGRVDARGLHQRLQPGLLRARERAEAGQRERAVLVDGRDGVGERRERDAGEGPRQRLVARPEEGLAELVDDAGAAELRERVIGGPRGDHGAVRKRLAGPMVVGYDDLEPSRSRLCDLLNRRHAA